jgi:hypothetical protein
MVDAAAVTQVYDLWHLLLPSYAPIYNYNHLWLLTFTRIGFQAVGFYVLGLVVFVDFQAILLWGTQMHVS